MTALAAACGAERIAADALPRELLLGDGPGTGPIQRARMCCVPRLRRGRHEVPRSGDC